MYAVQQFTTSAALHHIAVAVLATVLLLVKFDPHVPELCLLSQCSPSLKHFPDLPVYFEQY